MTTVRTKALVLAVASILSTAITGLHVEAKKSIALPTSFPAGFAVPIDRDLRVPVIGFGGFEHGHLKHNPVIFLHGNNDTPFPTACNPFGGIAKIAQFFLDRGYSTDELWGLGYQGDQCDLVATPTNRSGQAHTVADNVAELRDFVRAVRQFTGAQRVDIVAHSLGVVLAREWMRQDNAFAMVEHLVGISGPNHGIQDCYPGNPFSIPALGGFTPDSAICLEFGSPSTPLLTTLNQDETPGPTKYLVVYNFDHDFVYIPGADGVFSGLQPLDREGNPHDFSLSPLQNGAIGVGVSGSGAFDAILGTAHLGILYNPKVWQLAFDFVTADVVRANVAARE
jgi:pimeloyl-ACP methyl ester carboxylesterase